MKNRVVLWALMALPVLTQAQTIWRCGPDGRSFSDTPCAEGRTLAVADTRPSQDVAAARMLAEREIRLAERLRRERLSEEREQLGSGLAALGPASADAGVKPRRLERQQQPQTKQPQQPWRPHGAATEQTSRAVGPASRRAKG